MDKDQKIGQILVKDASYTRHQAAYCFIDAQPTVKPAPSSGLQGGVQDFFKRFGNLYYLLVKVFAPVVSSGQFKKTCRDVLNRYTDQAIILKKSGFTSDTTYLPYLSLPPSPRRDCFLSSKMA